MVNANSVCTSDVYTSPTRCISQSLLVVSSHRVWWGKRRVLMRVRIAVQHKLDRLNDKQQVRGRCNCVGCSLGVVRGMRKEAREDTRLTRLTGLTGLTDWQKVQPLTVATQATLCCCALCCAWAKRRVPRTDQPVNCTCLDFGAALSFMHQPHVLHLQYLPIN